MWLDTAGAYWTLLERVHRERVVAVPRDVGQRTRSTRATRSCRTAAGAAPRCRATSSASPARTATSPSRRSTCASRSSTATYDLLVWTTTPWTLPSNVGAAVGPTIDYVRVARARGRARPRAWRATASPPCSATTPRSSADVAGRRPRRRALRAAVHAASPVEGERAFTRRRRRLRHRRRRLRHRAPRARVRRDRPRGRRARRPPDRQPGQRRGPLRPTRRRAVRGQVREGRRPRPRRRPHGARASSSTVVDYTHSYPALLALRHAAHLLGQAHVVRAHVARTRTRCCARTRRSTGTPSTSSTAASATGSRTTSTGRSRATATGARRSRCGAAATAATTRASARSPSSSELSGRDLTGMDLHRPYVDDVTIRVPRVRRRAPRTASSRCSTRGSTPGSMPAAQFHYPFENADAFDTRFPADFICEAIDQTRGWFYSLLAVNTLVFDRTPYRNVVCLAHIVDQDGAEDVEVARQRHRPGAGARRARRRRAALVHVLVGLAVDAEARLRRRHRRGDPPVPAHALEHVLVLRHLRQPRRLDARRAAPPRPTHVLDRWIRSRLHRTVRTVTDALEDFDALAGDAGARRARRRPLELVRAPLAAALLEVVRPGRARDAARVPARRSRSCSRRSARSSPTRCTATSRGPTSRCTSPTGPTYDEPRSTTRSKPRWRSRAHARVARPRRAHRRQARRAPTAAARDRAADRAASRCATTSCRRSPTSST